MEQSRASDLGTETMDVRSTAGKLTKSKRESYSTATLELAHSESAAWSRAQV